GVVVVERLQAVARADAHIEDFDIGVVGRGRAGGSGTADAEVARGGFAVGVEQIAIGLFDQGAAAAIERGGRGAGRTGGERYSGSPQDNGVTFRHENPRVKGERAAR